jgi:hypothetical protein
VYAAAVSHADPAAGALRDADAAEPPQSEMLARDNDGAPSAPAPALSPVQVSVPSTDWSQLLADLPPLFSPTYVESHQYLLPVSPAAAAADVTMEENDSGSPCPGLWNF